MTWPIVALIFENDLKGHGWESRIQVVTNIYTPEIEIYAEKNKQKNDYSTSINEDDNIISDHNFVMKYRQNL